MAYWINVLMVIVATLSCGICLRNDKWAVTSKQSVWRQRDRMAGVVSGESVRRVLERDTGSKSGYKTHAQDCVVTRVGGNPLNRHYGAWYLCDGFSSRPFSCISVGSGSDSTFEHDFARKSLDSLIHVFDPTINHARFHDCSQKNVKILGLNSQKHDDQIKLRELGLSATPKAVSFFKSRNAKISSLSEVEVRGYH